MILDPPATSGLAMSETPAGSPGSPEDPRGADLAERPANWPQLHSASYRLAALDPDFLLGGSMRGVRFLLEFEKTDHWLRTFGVSSTIVVFGSSRIREDGPGAEPRWYSAARAFGALASERGGAIRLPGARRHNVIATGGGSGIMEAANRGAKEAGAVSIGLTISLPEEQEPNPFTWPELTFRFHYFAMRKMHLAMRANALVVFPGGFGTLDELFEVLTLRQTNKSPPIPIVLFDEAYWRSIINFDALLRAGMISADDLSLFAYAETPEEVWSRLLEHGLRPGEEPSWEAGRDIHED